MRVACLLFFLFWCLCYNFLHAQGSLIQDVSQDTTRAIDTTQPLTVSNIVITGNKHTKYFIILREMYVSIGDTISYSELDKRMQRSKQMIYNTSLFVDVQVYVKTREQNNIVIGVDVKEDFYFRPLPFVQFIDKNFIAWWTNYNHDLSRIIYGIKYHQDNVTGRNDDLYVWLLTGYTNLAQIKYSVPLADKNLRHGFSVTASYVNQRQLNIATEANKPVFYTHDKPAYTSAYIGVTYLYRPKKKITASVSVNYVMQTIVDTITKIQPNYFPNHSTNFNNVGITMNVLYQNVDYFAYPLKGYDWGVSLFTRGIVDPTPAFCQVSVSGSYNIPVYKKIYFSVEGVGILNVSSQNNFISQRLFGYGLGYSNYQMQGYDYNMIDGDFGAIVKATMKYKLYTLDVQLPFFRSTTHANIPIRFYPKVYVNAGYSYAPYASLEKNFLNNSTLYSGGAGLDVVSIYDFVMSFNFSINQFGGNTFYLGFKSSF